MTQASPEWRPIPGYEGYYEVSSQGQIRGVDRFVPQGNHKMFITGKVLTPAQHPTGHLWVNLRKHGRSKKMYVHRAVAFAFIGECPEEQEVRHLDGDATNNFVENIKYGTRSENLYDKVAHGTHFQARKTHCLRGHPYDEENTYYKIYKGKRSTQRNCRACRRERDKK